MFTWFIFKIWAFIKIWKTFEEFAYLKTEFWTWNILTVIIGLYYIKPKGLDRTFTPVLWYKPAASIWLGRTDATDKLHGNVQLREPGVLTQISDS